MPMEILKKWKEELSTLTKDESDIECRKRIDAYLDNCYGSCFLQDPRIAEVVQNNLLHFDGERYHLHAWCVMPNHVHVLFTPVSHWELSRIVQSWKSYTAHEGNKILQRSGEFWQPEPYDR